ncbi:putative mitochondrial protein AtMg01250 [Apium graveolens]|uniref:putative mitochondrial protein AtMg01250 n=1 Tax=Apium graveolens TaxID=4045 RepID=UPI003D7A7091
MDDFFKTIRLSVLVNGSPTSEFKMSNGVRQGDPLSPMLFNLAGEVINKLLIKANEIGLIEGVQLSKGIKYITHLQFADDTIVFLQVNAKSIWGIKKVLQCFQLLSGLRIIF